MSPRIFFAQFYLFITTIVMQMLWQVITRSISLFRLESIPGLLKRLQMRALHGKKLIQDPYIRQPLQKPS